MCRNIHTLHNFEPAATSATRSSASRSLVKADIIQSSSTALGTSARSRCARAATFLDRASASADGMRM